MNAFVNLHAIYGLSSEDWDVGRWVKEVSSRYGLYVNYMTLNWELWKDDKINA